MWKADLWMEPVTQKDGYIIRGGREMDMTYENLWDMFRDIPALELPAPYSVLDEYRLVNDNDPNYSKARLIHNQGQIKDFSKFGLEKKRSAGDCKTIA